MLRESWNAGVGVRGNRGIVLIEVFRRDGVLVGRVIVKVGHSEIRFEDRCTRKEGIVNVCCGRRDAVASVVGDQPLAGFARKRRRIEQYERRVVYLRTGNAGAERGVCKVRNCRSRTIVGKTNRNVKHRIADLLIGCADVLVRQESEELVLDDGDTQRAASGIAMQLGYFVVCRYVGILLEEEWCGVQPTGAAVNVASSMNLIGAGCGAHVYVRT